MPKPNPFSRKPTGDAGVDVALAMFSAMVENGIIPAHQAATILDDMLCSVQPVRAQIARRNLEQQLEDLPQILLAAAAARSQKP